MHKPENSFEMNEKINLNTKKKTVKPDYKNVEQKKRMDCGKKTTIQIGVLHQFSVKFTS